MIGGLLYQVVHQAASHHSKHDIEQAVVEAQHGGGIAGAAAHAVGGSGLQAQGGPGGLSGTGSAKAPPAAEEDKGQRGDEAAENVFIFAQGPVHEVPDNDHGRDEPQGPVEVEELVSGGAEAGGVEAKELPNTVDNHGQHLLRGIIRIEERGADDNTQHIAQNQDGQQRLDAAPGVLPGTGRGAAGHVELVVFAIGEVGNHEIAGSDSKDQQDFARTKEPVAALHPVAQATVAAHGNDPSGVEADNCESDQKAPKFNGHIPFFLCGLHDYTSISMLYFINGRRSCRPGQKH